MVVGGARWLSHDRARAGGSSFFRPNSKGTAERPRASRAFLVLCRVACLPRAFKARAADPISRMSGKLFRAGILLKARG